MEKVEKVIRFYTLTNNLKTLIRKGWQNWNVQAERIESVAEHIYGTQMLALAMYSEYGYDIDIEKVMYMLAIHELEEVIMGDKTYFEITKEEKRRLGHMAVEEILSDVMDKDRIQALIYEFDDKKTPEAIFAYHCDKLECDLQCKLYDEANYVDPYNQGDSPDHDPILMEKLKNKETTWSNSWMNHDRVLFTDDENFLEVLDYAIEKPITYTKKTQAK